jgi:hypothetical protein
MQHPEAGAVCGGYGAIDARGGTIIQFEGSGKAEEITSELQRGITRTHFCTFAVRLEHLQAIGGFREYFCTAEDVDLQLRLGDACRIWYLPGIYYHYRLHNTSITHTKSSTEREFFDDIAREFQQQRQTIGADAIQRGCSPIPPHACVKPPLSAAQHIQAFLLGEAWREYRDGQKFQALATGVRSALALPSNLSVWRSVLSLVVKLVSGNRGWVVKPENN